MSLEQSGQLPAKYYHITDANLSLPVDLQDGTADAIHFGSIQCLNHNPRVKLAVLAECVNAGRKPRDKIAIEGVADRNA